MQPLNRPVENNTIVAVSTPRGEAPVAIARLSGPDAVKISAGLFPGLENATAGYTALSERLVFGNGMAVPAKAYLMRAPSSYTRENIVEFHVPGSRPILQMLHDSLFAAGARPAEPGEFTRRAFMNGRIDLAQAEAVMAVINAADRAELRAAQTALRGEPSRGLADIRSRLIELLARVEVDLDFDEDEIGELEQAELREELNAIESALEKAASENSSLRERGNPRVLLFGLPNAGKSSLLNMLCGRVLAVTKPEPGTTRDTVTVEIEFKGIPLELIDSAGVAARHTEGSLARKACETALEEREESDIVVFIHDVTKDVSAEEAEFFDQSRPTVIVLNKTDLAERGSIPEEWKNFPVVETSCLTVTGRNRLMESIFELLGSGRVSLEYGYGSITARHRRHIQAALLAIERINTAGCPQAVDERIAFELREALCEIGYIVGETTTDDILDTIFTGFCIGK
ncbi:MAG: tRNA modification GTPase [Planctomycetota bacterium]|jgi:tRNA modification GTPase